MQKFPAQWWVRGSRCHSVEAMRIKQGCQGKRDNLLVNTDVYMRSLYVCTTAGGQNQTKPRERAQYAHHLQQAIW